MKIRWQRVTDKIVDGYVGDVRLFEIEQGEHESSLICELPHAARHHYGRLITQHATPKDAAKAARITLISWLKRLEQPD